MPKKVKSIFDIKVRRVAQRFAKIYYDTVDRRRLFTFKLYFDSGILTWKDKEIKGNKNIHDFINELPSSFHVVQKLSVRPILNSAGQGQLILLVQASGKVRFAVEHPTVFQQNFIITVRDNQWKIISHRVRIP